MSDEDDQMRRGLAYFLGDAEAKVIDPFKEPMSDTKASPGPWRWGTNGVGKTFVGSHLESADGDEIFSVDHGTPVSNPTDIRLIALAPTMASMLLELEWSGEVSGFATCPVCENHPTRTVNVPGDPVPGMAGFVTYTGKTKEIPGGHEPDCKLAAILSELRRP